MSISTKSPNAFIKHIFKFFASHSKGHDLFRGYNGYLRNMWLKIYYFAMKISSNHCIFHECFKHASGILFMLVHDEPHLIFKHVFYTSRQTCRNWPCCCRQSFLNLIKFFYYNIDWYLCKVSVLTSYLAIFIQLYILASKQT